SVQEVLRGIRGESYEVPPDFIMIGTSGGGELILFDMRKRPPWVSSVPAIGQAPETLYLLAHSFSDLLELFEKRPEDFSLDDKLGHEIILLNAQKAKNAKPWSPEQLKTMTEKYKLDKYAAGFRPIAGLGDDELSFLAVNESDGSICEVSC